MSNFQQVSLDQTTPGTTNGTTPVPATVGGLSVLCAVAGDGGLTALTNTAQTIKGSAGQLYGWYIYNPNAVVEYVCFYNATTPTVGATTCLMILAIPPAAAANIQISMGIAFSTAITVAASAASDSSSAPTTPLSAVFWYK